MEPEEDHSFETAVEDERIPQVGLAATFVFCSVAQKLFHIRPNAHADGFGFPRGHNFLARLYWCFVRYTIGPAEATPTAVTYAAHNCPSWLRAPYRRRRFDLYSVYNNGPRGAARNAAICMAPRCSREIRFPSLKQHKGETVQLTSNQKSGVVASCVWATVVLVYAFSGSSFSDKIFLRYGVLPLVVGWAAYFFIGSNVMSGTRTVAAVSAGSNSAMATPGDSGVSGEPRIATANIRFSARTFDLIVWGYVVWGLMDLVIRPSFPEFENLVSEYPWAVALLFPAFALPVALACDAASYMVFENTPGKAFYRITVEDRNGVRLAPRAYARRTIGVWGAGFGFNIPLLGLIANSISCRQLKKTGYTRYDATWGYVVKRKPISVARRCVIAVVAFLVYAGLLYGFIKPFVQDIGGAAGRNLALTELKAEGWMNPLTKRTILLSGWKPEAHEANTTGWTWTRPDGAVLIVFYGAGSPTTSLDDLASKLRAENSGVWKLTGAGKSYLTDGGYAWEGRRELNGNELTNVGFPAHLLTRMFTTSTGVWYVAYLTPVSSGSYQEGHKVADSIMASAAP